MGWKRLMIALVLVLACRDVAAQPGLGAPPPEATHPRWGLVFSGLGVLLTGQALAILIGAMHGFHDAAGWTLFPGAGPWIAAGLAASHPQGCLVEGPDCGSFASVPALVIAGAIQTAGAAMFALGFALPKRVTNRVAFGPSGIVLAF